jgi:hypothetical protein
VRLALKAVVQNDRDFVDVILLYMDRQVITPHTKLWVEAVAYLYTGDKPTLYLWLNTSTYVVYSHLSCHVGAVQTAGSVLETAVAINSRVGQSLASMEQ